MAFTEAELTKYNKRSLLKAVEPVWNAEGVTETQKALTMAAVASSLAFTMPRIDELERIVSKRSDIRSGLEDTIKKLAAHMLEEQLKPLELPGGALSEVKTRFDALVVKGLTNTNDKSRE